MTQPGSSSNDSPSPDDCDPAFEGDARDDSDSYRRIRDEFDSLGLEHQATFLVDATVSLLAKGIEAAGRALADEVDGFVERQRKKAAQKKSRSAGPYADDSPKAASDSASTKSGETTASTAASSSTDTAASGASPTADPSTSDADDEGRDNDPNDETNGPSEDADDRPPREPLG